MKPIEDMRMQALEELGSVSDAAGLESLRKAELGLLDNASAEMSGALVKLSDVLTKEQRRSLMQMAKKHRRHHH